MNENQTIRTAVSVGGFFARHLLALGLMVGVPCVLWTVFYVVLLVSAMIWGGGMGSPVLYPLGLVFIFTMAMGFGVFLCLPVISVAEWITRRRGWSMIVQLPVSLGIMMLVLVIGGVCIAAQEGGESWLVGPVIAGAGFLVLVVPFTLYWGVAQSVPMSWAVIRCVRGFFRRRDLLNDG